MISCSHWGIFEVPLRSWTSGTSAVSDLARQMLIGGACSDYYDAKYLHG